MGQLVTNYSALYLIQAQAEILLIPTVDYGPCWAHCIYTLYLRQIHNYNKFARFPEVWINWTALYMFYSISM